MKARLLIAAVLAAALAPALAAGPTPVPRAASAANPHAGPGALPTTVDINSADLATLQALPGVTRETAEKIIAGRPYPTKAHLVTRKIVSDDVYEAIRKDIAARQKPPSKAKKPARAASKP